MSIAARILPLILLTASLAAPALTVTEGEMRFTCDDRNGRKRLVCAGSALDLPPVEITLDRHPAPLPLRRTASEWNEKTRTLSETYRGDRLQVIERFRFADGALSRDVELRADPEPDAPLKLRGVAFPARIDFTGQYFLPASEFGNGAVFDPEMRGAIPAPNRSFKLFHPNYSFAPLLLESADGVCWFFLSDGRQERCQSGLMSGRGAALAVQQFKAEGWLEPGVPQTVGPAELRARQTPLETARRQLPVQWYRRHGFVPPADRPEWVTDAILYSCHPLGTIRSGLTDLGGFKPAREELLPIIDRLGFNTVWLLPLEDQWIYWPRDYYQFLRKLEGPDAYRALLTEAHRRHLRVIQDIVPHGGSPAFARKRGNSPLSLCFDEKGRVPGYQCFDYGDRNWQQYLHDVAVFYQGHYPLDGFRIDAVNGSNQLNWKRPGFAPVRPSGLDAAWWDAELKKTAPERFRLDYPRASMGMRAAGLAMIDTIRRAVKTANPAGMVLAETNTPLAVGHADAVYDAQFCHHTVNKMREMPLSVFAAGLMARQDEQLANDPPGLIRMRCVDNHDTTNLLGLQGLAAWKALHAVIFALPGLPMLYQEKEMFQGPFLAKLIELRRTLPELRRGDTAYPRDAVSNPAVFAVRREYRGQATLALVNFSPTPVTATLKLPSAAAGPYPVRRELLTGKTLTDRITLAPWQPAFIALRTTPDALPSVAPLYGTDVKPPSAAPDAAVTIAETPDQFHIRTAAYEARVSRQDGMLLEMKASRGPIAGRTSFSADRHTAIPAPAAVERKDRTLRCRSGRLTWQWTFRPEGVGLEIGPERNGDTDLNLIVPVKTVTRWQAVCAEGRIDDYHFTRHRSGSPGKLPGYRLYGDNTVWNHETMPLSPSRPLLLAADNRGAMSFRFRNLLDRTPANLRVLDHYNRQDGWFLAIACREAPLQPFFPARPAGPIALDLDAGLPRPDAVPDRYDTTILPDGLTLSHNSLEWVVKGRFGEVTLTRAGGVIRELRNRRGQVVLQRAGLYTDRGFGRKNSDRHRSGYPALDPESGMIAHRDREGLKLTFYGQLRDNGCWRSLEEPIWFVNAYCFRPDGSIRVGSAFYSEGKPRFASAFLAWKGSVPGLAEIGYDNGPLAAVNPPGKGRSNQVAAAPPSIRLRTANGIIVLDRIGTEGPTRPEVFCDNRSLFFAWLNGPTAPFRDHCRYALEFNLRLDP